MLTVAYCRVSTEEQATEGFSIDGQADKLRVYAELHDLGDVTVIADPGRSGKDLERPGLQQVLAMVDQAHVANVLTWRLDRLSRNLSDLILLADRFGQAGVALHSFTEKIDLSSATGRMFYNILGSFAQFYREQLAENVRMGMQQAVRQGRWVNRPKTGYDLVDGELVPNEMAPVVRRIFTMRSEGASQGAIADATGVKYSTVLSILGSRIYLGEVQMNGEWFPGIHEPVITPELFAAAHRGRIKGRNKGRDLLGGKVRCGLCRRLMAIDRNGQGTFFYRCKHRGEGCAQPRRTNVGLQRAAVLGLRLIGHDEGLQMAIRHELERARTPAVGAGGGSGRRSHDVVEELEAQRRKLLRLFYEDRVGADLFAEEEARLTKTIAAARSEVDASLQKAEVADDLSRKFDDVARILADLDIDRVWSVGTEVERRVLLDEFLREITVLPDHLEVAVSGALPVTVCYGEIGMKESGFGGVGGGT
jgi:DNA invertase Pin-like site-specific DNA recombinase